MNRTTEEPFIEQHIEGEGAHPSLFRLEAWMNAYPGLTAGFTGRHGGVSDAPWHSLNGGLHVEDDPQRVIRNRELLADTVGVPLDSWTYGEQVHGSRVQIVDRSYAGKGTRSRDDAIPDTDAFITREHGLILGAMFADCVPLFFYDPEHDALGVAHAGWKGTVLQVAQATMEAMTGAFGSRPEAVLAAIGPSIGACCYEVDDKVASRVREELGEWSEAHITIVHPGAYLLNLQELNRQIMIKAGIMPFHIEMTRLCTSCRVDKFFSHRKEQGRTGRMVAWIGRLPQSMND